MEMYKNNKDSNFWTNIILFVGWITIHGLSIIKTGNFFWWLCLGGALAFYLNWSKYKRTLISLIIFLITLVLVGNQHMELVFGVPSFIEIKF